MRPGRLLLTPVLVVVVCGNASRAMADGIDTGRSWTTCVVNTSSDSDKNGLDDLCEAQLATSFRPQLVFGKLENSAERWSHWSTRQIKYRWVRIFYALSYYRDTGLPGTTADPTQGWKHHLGDSEFVILDISNDSGTTWTLENITLSRIWRRLKNIAFIEAAAGQYNIDAIEDRFDAAKANDEELQRLKTCEAEHDRNLVRALNAFPFAEPVFGGVKGIGPRIMGQLISAIMDMKRFEVLPDPMKMARARTECAELERQANFERDVEKIIDRLADGKGDNHTRKLKLVRSWKRENGKEAEALLLDAAIALMEVRRKLWRVAERKSMARMESYCGLALTAEGKFMRQQSGQRNTWSKDARWAFWQVTKQFIKVPGSQWDLKLRAQVVAFRVRHPVPVPMPVFDGKGKPRCKKGTEEPIMVTAYTDGHIWKMAMWRIANRLARHLYRNWMRVARTLDQESIEKVHDAAA